MKLIILGKAGSGKDTVGDYLVEQYGYTKYSFAAKLKEICHDLFPELMMLDRRNLLQTVGSKMRQIQEDVWINYLLSAVETDRAVITDCRYENEIETCINRGYVSIEVLCNEYIRDKRLILRDGRTLTSCEKQHPSEQLSVKTDYALDNNGSLSNLYKQIDEVVTSWQDVD